jgi:hypothetical protein
MTLDSIEAQQAEICLHIENLETGGSEEEYEALVLEDERLTAAKAGVRAVADTPPAKSLAARIKQERAVLAELEASPDDTAGGLPRTQEIHN